jgi:hypothetical protein
MQCGYDQCLPGQWFPEPPAAEDTEGALNNRVVARFVDGRTVKGTTVDFLPGKDVIHVIEAIWRVTPIAPRTASQVPPDPPRDAPSR